MLDAVKDRLEARLPEFAGRIETAVDFTRLLKDRGLPQSSTAFVIPLGLQGQRANDATGIFSQAYSETVGVLLVARSHDQTGSKALGQLRPIIGQVLEALAGWSPGSDFGVFELRRGDLAGVGGGALFYMIEFSINDQLRITVQ
ncbi:phage tail terminator protein [Tritonibacter scottomollicae]|uniref:Uncharacterized protein n=1 Tax=Tritonibacter scottomollicae TaxID=483013 RepID=A0A2T1AII1_TRISK|nr:hypothetical protein [Tritonibacter scottomollicae]PRZ48347.1 hypothetical protein CLV89_104175 [Tritonibacter scottomollicae]